uniref:Uncharacterized protein n=1 Tax=Picea glauca TaxID=3330 RepID=A0A101M080_PICGL|nr:hypothetical protein ABT39_MTgene4625 [Picea glauca]QHR92491.1 hypothetical protein Q903MT_gene6537 [Picea sitchensis]
MNFRLHIRNSQLLKPFRRLIIYLLYKNLLVLLILHTLYLQLIDIRIFKSLFHKMIHYIKNLDYTYEISFISMTCYSYLLPYSCFLSFATASTTCPIADAP